MLRSRNVSAFLAAFSLGIPLASCTHLAAEAGGGTGQVVVEPAFSGRWSEPGTPAPGAPALLIVGFGSAGLSSKLATAALEAGVAVFELRGGDPVQAARWLEPRARRLFVAESGESRTSGAAHLAGRVLLTPTTVPDARAGLQPCLVLRGGEPASTQHGALWQVSFPDLAEGKTLTPDDEHSLFELVVLWLRARAVE
jgi:hypothetical protein